MQRTIDAIILVGGLGRRLKGVVADVPKPLARVKGKPFLERILHPLEKSGCIRKIVLAAGYMAEKIQDFLARREQRAVEITLVREASPLGTGGAIKNALGETESNPVLVANGDSYVEFDVEQLLETHHRARVLMTMVLKKQVVSGRFGLVEMDGESKVVAFREKQGTDQTGHINTGVYVMDPRLFGNVEPLKPSSLEIDLIPDFLRRHAIQGFVTAGKFIDIGVPESYGASQNFFEGE